MKKTIVHLYSLKKLHKENILILFLFLTVIVVLSIVIFIAMAQDKIILPWWNYLIIYPILCILSYTLYLIVLVFKYISLKYGNIFVVKWMKKHNYKISSFISFFFLFLYSIKNCIQLDNNKTEKIITLIWTLQGLTMTLFVFFYFIQTKLEQERKMLLESVDIKSKLVNGNDLVCYHNNKIQDSIFDIFLIVIGLLCAVLITSKYIVEMDTNIQMTNSFKTYLIFTFYLSTYILTLVISEMFVIIIEDKQRSVIDNHSK